jgi:hypothetical protein
MNPTPSSELRSEVGGGCFHSVLSTQTEPVGLATTSLSEPYDCGAVAQGQRGHRPKGSKVFQGGFTTGSIFRKIFDVPGMPKLEMIHHIIHALKS